MSICDNIRDRFALYLDGELQGDERIMFASHVESCEPCRLALEGEREFIEAIRAAGPSHLASPELRARVTTLLEETNPATALPTVLVQPKRTKTIVLAIAAALLVLMLPVVIWRFISIENKTPVGQPSTFALMAAETHLRRTRGQLPLEMETESPGEISRWFSNKVNFSVTLPNYQESSGQDKLYTLEGARLVGFRDDYAAYVAYQMRARPISLVITSDSVAKPSGGEEIAAKGLKFHYDAIQGLKVITWSDRGLTYALVSDFEERGQQSCIVCHQGTKDRDFIEPLKPKSN
jgi:anti-sigma factor RsiW